MKTTTTRPVVTREQWNEARIALLKREKAATHERDAISAARRSLPMVKVEKSYVFEDAAGKSSLVGLFSGKSQLITYHFMFDPSWDAACKACSFLADTFGPNVVHLAACDIAFVAVSRASVAKIEAYKKRMGWSFRWLSSANTDFNVDYHATIRADDAAASYNYGKAPHGAGEMPGCSVFLRSEKDVFHTYSTYGRGLDVLMGAYNYIDLAPLGRNEATGENMKWLRRHDEYQER